MNETLVNKTKKKPS